jgi:hypothetical protein
MPVTQPIAKPERALMRRCLPELTNPRNALVEKNWPPLA